MKIKNTKNDKIDTTNKEENNEMDEDIVLKNVTYDENKITDQTFNMVVQVNGKVRGKMEVDANTSNEEMESLAFTIENVKKFVDGKEIVKGIVIPSKMVNIVVKEK